MAQRPLGSSGYQYCNHCNRTLHRSVVWRHQILVQQTDALAAAVDIPLADPPSPSPSPPPDLSMGDVSMGDLSITTTEQALSDIHLSDIEDEGLDISHLPAAQLTPVPQQSSPHQEEWEHTGSDVRSDGPGDESIHFDNLDETSQEYGAETADMMDAEAQAVTDAMELLWSGSLHEEGTEHDGDQCHDEAADGPLVPDGNAGDADGEDDSRSLGTLTETSINSEPQFPSSSPLPELALIWDLQAARHRKFH